MYILGLCEGKADNTFLRQVLDTGLQCTMNRMSVTVENSDFWYEMRGKINDLEDSEFIWKTVKKSIWKFWNSRRNKGIQVDESKFDPTPKLAKAYNAQKANTYPGRKCDYCEKHRPKMSKSHNTDKCFFGDVKGTERLKSFNAEGNKDTSNYTALLSAITIYDTGCTPTSFFKDLPNKFVSRPGWVKTAADHQVATKGTGEIQIGKLKIEDVVHVPDFKYNLLSGIQLMKCGYTQILGNDELKIFDESGTIVAQGKYNAKLGLIEMMRDTEMHASQVSSQLPLSHWH